MRSGFPFAATFADGFFLTDFFLGETLFLVRLFPAVFLTGLAFFARVLFRLECFFFFAAIVAVYHQHIAVLKARQADATIEETDYEEWFAAGSPVYPTDLRNLIHP